jgi:uncharacterized Zn finger protein (UPF0148 family)
MNKEEENTNKQKENQPEEDKHNLEEKLEELLRQGWIMLPESCRIPRNKFIKKIILNCFTNLIFFLDCNCPLMQTPNGEKYCAGCESWQFEHQRPQKHKFGELVPLSKDTDIQLKNTQISKINNRDSFDYMLNESLIRCLQTKLYFLTTLLNNEIDVLKIRDILSTINLCLQDISMAVSMEKVKQ